MKINWVAPHFHPETGGVETHVAQISNYLVDRGHEVTVHSSAVTVSRKILPLSGNLGKIEIKPDQKRYEVKIPDSTDWKKLRRPKKSR